MNGSPEIPHYGKVRPLPNDRTVVVDFQSLGWLPLGAYDFSSLLARHVHERFREALASGKTRREAIRSPAELQRHQAAWRADLVSSLGGLLPAPAGTTARMEGDVALDGLVIERLAIAGRPGESLPANLYRPRQARTAAPAVLFVCGHTASGRLDPMYQSVCQILAQSGLIVLALDPPGQGERMAWPKTAGRFESAAGDATLEHAQLGVAPLLRGENLLRYIIHDNQIALSYLASRPDVDASRLGVTGNSGGGLQSAVLAALDDRISAAAPGTWLSTLEGILRSGEPQDAEQIWHGYAGRGYDHHDLVLAACPKSYLILAAEQDFFPIEGVDELEATLPRFWDLAGSAGRFRVFRQPVPHSYTREMAQAAAAFFCDTWQMPRPADGLEPIGILPENALRAWPDFPTSERVPAWAKMASRASVQGAEWLSAAIRSRRPEVLPRPRLQRLPTLDHGLAVDAAYWWTQPDLANFALLFRRELLAFRSLRIALWEGGSTEVELHRDEIEAWTEAGEIVAVLDVTGTGRMAPNPLKKKYPLEAMFGTVHVLAEHLSMLGDELLFVRCWDLLRLPTLGDALPETRGLPIELAPAGRWRLPARIASLLEPRLILSPDLQCAESLSDLAAPPPHQLDNLRPFLAHGLLGAGGEGAISFNP